MASSPPTDNAVGKAIRGPQVVLLDGHVHRRIHTITNASQARLLLES